MVQPLFLHSVMQEKIWGGTRLRDEFGYDIPSDHVGEFWAISAHPHGVSKVANGPYEGMGLDQLYQDCLLYTSPSPRDLSTSRMPSSA